VVVLRTRWGRLLVRWQRPARPGRDTAEAFRRHLMDEHAAGRLSLWELERRYERFCRRHPSALD
jgi:hypothetical protein